MRYKLSGIETITLGTVNLIPIPYCLYYVAIHFPDWGFHVVGLGLGRIVLGTAPSSTRLRDDPGNQPQLQIVIPELRLIAHIYGAQAYALLWRDELNVTRVRDGTLITQVRGDRKPRRSYKSRDFA